MCVCVCVCVLASGDLQIDCTFKRQVIASTVRRCCAVFEPSENTDQGVFHICKFLGVKLASTINLKAWTCACATERDLHGGFSKRTRVGTPEMVNCECKNQSQWNLRWRLAVIDVQIVRYTCVQDRESIRTLQQQVMRMMPRNGHVLFSAYARYLKLEPSSQRMGKLICTTAGSQTRSMSSKLPSGGQQHKGVLTTSS